MIGSLRKEHVKLLKMLSLIERLVLQTDRDVRNLSHRMIVRKVAAFQRAFTKHATREEKRLYTIVQRYTEAGDGLVRVMLDDHRRVSEAINRSLFVLDGGTDMKLSISKLKLTLSDLYPYLVDHFAKEDKVVFWYLEVELKQAKSRHQHLYAHNGESTPC